MTAWLRAQGYKVNPKRVRRLFRRKGLQAIYPRKRISFSLVISFALFYINIIWSEKRQTESKCLFSLLQ